jgi:hypothetical protein
MVSRRWNVMKGLADGLWRAEVEEGVEGEDGRWKMEDGRWKMEDGRWKMEDGRWKMEDGRWKMEMEARSKSALDLNKRTLSSRI